jgi:hypothetical protein
MAMRVDRSDWLLAFLAGLRGDGEADDGMVDDGLCFGRKVLILYANWRAT